MCTRMLKSSFAINNIIYNAEKDTFHELNCKSWACPECRKTKIFFMKKGLAEHFKDNKGMRMMTVTLAAGDYDVPEHLMLLNKAYMYFIKNLRRSTALNPHQRQFKYVKCIEAHDGKRNEGHAGLNTGYAHFHIMIDRFLPVQILQAIFESSVISAGYETDKPKYCNINIKLIPNVHTAINYVIKYIVKAVGDFARFVNKWSKSRGTPIYTHDDREGIYILVKIEAVKHVLPLYLCSISQETPNKNGALLEKVHCGVAS